jgi:hypothetical protein
LLTKYPVFDVFRGDQTGQAKKENVDLSMLSGIVE